MHRPAQGMLEVSWEAHATVLANASDEGVQSALDDIAKAVGVSASTGGGRVLVARDTRPHSQRLSSLALEGAAHTGDCTAEDHGLLTTPQLHHIVRHTNGEDGAGPHVGPAAWASEAGYYEMIVSAYSKLVPRSLTSRTPLWVDCACGIGAPQLAKLGERLGGHVPITLANRVGEGELNADCGAEFVQKGRKAPRGLESAAAAAGVERACSVDGDADRIVFHYWRRSGFTAPAAAAYLKANGVESAIAAAIAAVARDQPADPVAHIGRQLLQSRPAGSGGGGGDGDGWGVHGVDEWRLLDGDKIAALFASFLCVELTALALVPALSMAVVQTAYANGASGAYIRSLGVPTRLAKTGVKHVHHVAIEYDVSVYFEANGHGESTGTPPEWPRPRPSPPCRSRCQPASPRTARVDALPILLPRADWRVCHVSGTLLLSDKAMSAIHSAREAARASNDATKLAAADRILAARQLVNQAIGDAISDLLLVEVSHTSPHVSPHLHIPPHNLRTLSTHLRLPPSSEPHGIYSAAPCACALPFHLHASTHPNRLEWH